MIEFLAAALLIISFAEINEVNNIAKQLDTVSSQVRTVSGKVDTVSSQVRTVSTRVDLVQHEVVEVSTKVDVVRNEIAGVSEKVDTMQHKIAEVSRKVDTAIGEIKSLGVNTAPTEVTIVLPHIEKVLSAIKEMLSDININTTHTIIYRSDSSPITTDMSSITTDTSPITTDTSSITTDTSSATPDSKENYGYADLCKLIPLGCETSPHLSFEGTGNTVSNTPPLYFDNRLTQEIDADYQKISGTINRLEHWVINNRADIKKEIELCKIDNKKNKNLLACYYAFILKKIDVGNLKENSKPSPSLREDIGASLNFFEKLSECHYSADCDRGKTQGYLIEKAISIYANFFPYVCNYRDNFHAISWKNIEKLFGEILRKPEDFTSWCRRTIEG